MNELKQSETPPDFPASLTAPQRTALLHLIAGRPHTAAAAAAGVSRTTLWRWLRDDPVFVAELNRLAAEIAASTTQGLLVLSSLAVRELGRLIRSRKTPAAIRLRACEAVLRATAGRPVAPLEPEGAALLIAAKRDRDKLGAYFLRQLAEEADGGDEEGDREEV